MVHLCAHTCPHPPPSGSPILEFFSSGDHDSTSFPSHVMPQEKELFEQGDSVVASLSVSMPAMIPGGGGGAE